MIGKLKVVWICHFTTDHIQTKLNVRKKIDGFANWISLGIEEIKKRNDIELHVISPHRWISRSRKFQEENISYYFFNPGIPLYGRHWPSFFRLDYFTNFYFNKKRIKNTVKKINPDIINLHGIENAYYSSSILKLQSYPILITIQGLNSLNSKNPNNYIIKKKLELEQRILKEFQNFGIRVKFLQDYIRKLNSDARFFWFKYPHNIIFNPSSNVKKTYDCVFFARVSKEKGVEDLIDALYLVKQSIPNISLKIIGSCNRTYQQYLLKIINQKDLTDNIKLVGFLPPSRLHKVVIQSRLSVLPTYNDILPGTIIESLKLGVPVVAYAANGVIDFNEKHTVIRLIKLGDITGFAKEIITLLRNHHVRNSLAIKSIKYADEEFDNTKEVNKMIESYKEVIYKYHSFSEG